MDSFGWILLHKCLLNWEWYKDINTKCLFIHCLLKANYSDNDWKGKTIKRGQFFTSLETLSHELNMSIKEIRGAIKKLEKTKELGIQGASNGTMITICKYEDYQNLELLKGKQKGKQRASKGQAKRQQYKEELKEEELKENNIELYFQNISSLTWHKWTDYKKAQYKFSYKTKQSEQIALNELINLAKNDPVIADKIVNHSIANGYKGLFELKNGSNGNVIPESKPKFEEIPNTYAHFKRI